MSIKIRSQHFENFTELKILISHPMENGRHRDAASGELIPAHFIQTLDIRLNDQPLLNAQLGGSVSKDPFFSFRVQDCQSGDRVSVRWEDNWHTQDSAEHVIEF